MRTLTLSLMLFVLVATVAAAREFYQFTSVPDVQDRDIYLLRRPAKPGFDNTTGSRVITGDKLRSGLSTYTQGANEPGNTPKLRVYDNTGTVRMIIDATGAIVIR